MRNYGETLLTELGTEFFFHTAIVWLRKIRNLGPNNA
jgi:hypothetical protein